MTVTTKTETHTIPAEPVKTPKTETVTTVTTTDPRDWTAEAGVANDHYAAVLKNYQDADQRYQDALTAEAGAKGAWEAAKNKSDAMYTEREKFAEPKRTAFERKVAAEKKQTEKDKVTKSASDKARHDRDVTRKVEK